MAQARGPKAMMALFAAVLAVGLLMVFLPPLIFDVPDENVPGQPFDPTVLGWVIVAVGLVGLAIGWMRQRRG